jgi:hypothetical protein
MTTLTFQKDIDNAFGEYIDNGMIECSKDQFHDIISGLFSTIKKRGKSQNGANGTARKKRKPANFMVWLNSGFRDQIKEEYFGDFDLWVDWSESGIKSYYKKKELPLNKLELLISKKKAENKEIKKPRLMSLITIKAGIIWKDMTIAEKAQYEVIPEDEAEDDQPTNIVETTAMKSKKGRPSGYKPKNYSTDEQILQALNKAAEPDDDEAIAVEEIIYKGVSYMKDEAGNIYNEDSEIVGKYISEDNVVFS